MKTAPHSSKSHCMVVHAYYPLAETRVQRQAEALLEHGYEVDVICMRSKVHKEKPFENVRGVDVYRLPVGRNHLLPGFGGRFIAYVLFILLATLKLIPLHLKRRYGVVQAHNLPDFVIFSTLFPKLMGARTILDIHDVMPEFFAEQTGRSMQSLLVRLIIWQEQISCRFADHVITVTELWRQALIARGLPAEKTSVVMNLADHHVFRPEIRDQTTNHQPNNRFHLIYHGVQSERHGLDTLLYALDQVRAKTPNLYLVLHGRGDFQEELIKLTARLNLNDRVKFSTEMMPLDDLPGFVGSHDAGVVPYQNDVFTGGILPTKLLEYTALRMPTIVAGTPVVKGYFDETMVQFFEPGNVAELAESIVNIYQDETLRERLVKASERFNQQYNWPLESAKYVELIDRLNQR